MEKSKLKLLSITLAAMIIMFSFTFFDVTAASNTTTYEIPELAMTMDIPTNIKVMTQGIKQSDPLFSTETFDYIQTMSKFRENNDYFYGKDSTGNLEFEVILTEDKNGIENLTKLSEKKQNLILELFSQQSDVMESSLYKTDNVVFIEASRSINHSDGRFFTKEYYTIYNRQDITVKLSSNNDNLSSQELELLEAIVDSIRFSKEKNINITEAISTSELVLFCFITIAFIILVINKIQSIKKEQLRAERRQSRIKARAERDRITTENNQKSVQLTEETNNTEPTTESSENQTVNSTDKTHSESTLEEETKESEPFEKEAENILDDTKLETTSNDPNPNTAENNSEIKTNSEIDLDAAIANFENSAEARQKRRERNKEKNKKKSKLPFGK